MNIFYYYIYFMLVLYSLNVLCEIDKNTISSKIPIPLVNLGLKLFDNNETYLLDIINSIEEQQELIIGGMSLTFVQ